MIDSENKRMIDLAIDKLFVAELTSVFKLVESAIKDSDQYHSKANLLQLLKNDNSSTSYKIIAVMVNRTWRTLSSCSSPVKRAELIKELVFIKEKCAHRLLNIPCNKVGSEDSHSLDINPAHHSSLDKAIISVYVQSVGRSPVQDEIDIWKVNFNNGLPFHEFMLAMADSQEAKRLKKSKDILSEKSDAEFIQIIYELIYGKGCFAWEINHWVTRIISGDMSREDIFLSIFHHAAKAYEGLDNYRHDGLSCHIMGTNRVVSADDWKIKADMMQTQSESEVEADKRHLNRFYIKTKPSFLVTAVASLYKGGDYIEQFMDNITSQSIFKEYCELVIIDADSPENEAKIINRYLSKYPNINYLRMNYRIGIYDAWNVGVKAARGDYITNTNLDDLRRHDSLELQASVLDNLSFVDVTYQDLYYTFDPNLSFEEIAKFGYETNLPIVTPFNLMKFNSPHNAPMWRKSLHDELGYFNINYKSAGDYEFWLRCLVAGKNFYKLNDPHVVYYQNPNGLSTRPGTRGVVEAKEIHKTYARQLISKNFVMPFEDFCSQKLPNMPIVMDAGKNDRYAQTQRALRNLARHIKYSTAKGN